jgi:hypothetical protein
MMGMLPRVAATRSVILESKGVVVAPSAGVSAADCRARQRLSITIEAVPTTIAKMVSAPNVIIALLCSSSACRRLLMALQRTKRKRLQETFLR